MLFTNGLIAAAVLLGAGGASAAPPAEPDPAAPAAAGEPAASEVAVADAAADHVSEKKICRTEKVTGSLSRRNRICLTEAQWREVHDRTRRGVGELQDSASGGKMCVPDPADPFQGCPG
jgi:hypothetical protein